jgi:hypothetical protein
MINGQSINSISQTSVKNSLMHVTLFPNYLKQINSTELQVNYNVSNIDDLHKNRKYKRGKTNNQDLEWYKDICDFEICDDTISQFKKKLLHMAKVNKTDMWSILNSSQETSITKENFNSFLKELKMNENLEILWFSLTGSNNYMSKEDLEGRWIPIRYSHLKKTLVSGKTIGIQKIYLPPKVIEFLKEFKAPKICMV